MLKLTNEGVFGNGNADKWQEAGYIIPQFDRDGMIKETDKAPVWVHFGAGNIFRAFQANAVQKLLDSGRMKAGVIAVDGHGGEVIKKVYRPHDNMSILVTLKSDGTMEKKVIASVADTLIADRSEAQDVARLGEIFENNSLQMVSFTITEKGYNLTDADGKFFDDVEADFGRKPDDSVSYMGIAASLLYRRFKAGAKPIAMVSMDNCSHNGDKLRGALCEFARRWEQAGLVQEGFTSYMEDKSRVSFPWTMIDKITPQPHEEAEKLLSDADVRERVVTSRGTRAAAFVNAEECEYLVIEDDFPNGRPPLEESGIIFTDRETVERAERMKVCTCLNPLHTALAVFGCLLDYDTICSEMKDPLLKKLVEHIGYDEGMPVVEKVDVLDPNKFIDEVLNKRLVNPFLPDTPWRIATDTSQKLPIRFGETIKAYQKSDVLDVKELKYIPLVFAGWLRYLMGINDKGTSFEPSPDPMLETLCPYMKKVSLGDTDIHDKVYPVLSDEKLFGVDLYEAGLGELTERYFIRMNEGEGAVEKTLKSIF